ncbi:MAG: RNA methyltransferase [Pseudomonadota bacterium]|jgi:tRNA/rRNA methyltransferase|nr:RNA methyltransferase [Alphaproteobacteria bacterium]
MNKPIVLLHQVQLAENLGAVARAMGNFGLEQLRLIQPKCDPDDAKAVAMAAGNEKVLEKASIYQSLEHAVGDLELVFATTAIERELIKNYCTPKTAILLIQDRKVGFLFGPERTGLTNEDLSVANCIITVPVNPDFSSLNIGQAVVIVLYEWYQLQVNQESWLHLGDTKPVQQKELQGFFKLLEAELDTVNFWRVPHKKEKMWQNIRAAFLRMQPTEQEIRTLYGAIQAIKK